MFTHCNLVLPPCHPEADAGFIVMEPTDYPSMSGSNCICTVTVLLETGILPMQYPTTSLTLDTPAGLVRVLADCKDSKCERVTLTNVPCFVVALDAPLEVEGLGSITIDIAYGGAFFALVDARSCGLTLTAGDARRCVELGERIKAAAAKAYPVAHPTEPAIHTITFVEFTLPLEPGTTKAGAPAHVGRNAVVVSPGKIDRSPCGTGTSARLAVLHARGLVGVGETLSSRSLLDTEFVGTITAVVQLTPEVKAVVPTISGRAWITSMGQYGLDPEDPFPEGYVLSDTWHQHPLGQPW